MGALWDLAMLMKILVTGGIVIGALMAMRVFGRAVDTKMTREEEQARNSARRKVKGEDFVRCEDCGSYTAKTDPCACKS